MSAIIARAVVEVEPEEVADAEGMLALLDGRTSGHYGLKVVLVSIEKPPKYRKNRQGSEQPESQFGFPGAKMLKTKRRYYYVVVDRD